MIKRATERYSETERGAENASKRARARLSGSEKEIAGKRDRAGEREIARDGERESERER